MIKRLGFIVITIFIAGVFLVLRFCPKKQTESLSVYKDKHAPESSINLALKDFSNDFNPKESSMPALDRFALEMSRAICKQEQADLSATIDHSIEGLKPGDAVPIDSEAKLTPSQAIQWLRKTANSKCSSFRQSNAELFFKHLSVNKDNYKSAYGDYELLLQEYRGLTPYKLIKESLDALDRANEDEAKLLKDAIVFSLTTYINDASSDVDITGAMWALKAVREKGLLDYPAIGQIEQLLDDYKKISDEHILTSQRFNKKYLTEIDFSKVTSEQIAYALGEEGVKEDLRIRREEYEDVRQYGKKLLDILKKTF